MLGVRDLPAVGLHAVVADLADLAEGLLIAFLCADEFAHGINLYALAHVLHKNLPF